MHNFKGGARRLIMILVFAMVATGLHAQGSFLERLISRMTEPEPWEPAFGLIGENLPEATLDLIGGGELAIEPGEREDILVLDFWATWCPPCIVGLPILARVQDKYADSGVRVIAINSGETPAIAEEFVKKHGLTLPVALDPNDEFSNRLLVRSIPQTVLVGRDGRIHQVHVGLHPDMEERLGAEIDALLAGEDLAASSHRDRPRIMTAPHGPSFGKLAAEWSAQGMYYTIQWDEETERIMASTHDGRLVSFTMEGEVDGSIDIAGGSHYVFARLQSDGPTDLVSYGFHQTVVGLSRNGTRLWSFDTGQSSVNSVIAEDLDGDGIDEILVALPEDGIVALGPDGTELWRDRRLGSVDIISVSHSQQSNDWKLFAVTEYDRLDVLVPGPRWDSYKRIPFKDQLAFPVGERAAEEVIYAVGEDFDSWQGDVLRTYAGSIDHEFEWTVRVRVDEFFGQDFFMATALSVSPSGRYLVVDSEHGCALVDMQSEAVVNVHLEEKSYQADLGWHEAEGEEPWLFIGSDRALVAYRIPADLKPAEKPARRASRILGGG